MILTYGWEEEGVVDGGMEMMIQDCWIWREGRKGCYRGDDHLVLAFG